MHTTNYLGYLSTELLRRAPGNVIRRFATVTEAKRVSDEPIQTFRTIESDPGKHGRKHLNRFYTVPPAVVKTVFQHGGLPLKFKEQTTSFLETCLLVREPALDVIACLKATDYSRPVNRYVLCEILCVFDLAFLIIL